MACVDEIEALFERHGHTPYDGARHEAVSATAHALQCAQLAEWARAGKSLVAAAFLHDIGHLLAADALARNDRVDEHVDDRHEWLAVPFLSAAFGPEVTEPVRLHVQARRYLVRVDAAYARDLSPASQHSLALQGGPMGDDEMAAFSMLPFADEATKLRRWDDLAKTPACVTPPLEWYLALLRELPRAASASSPGPG